MALEKKRNKNGQFAKKEEVKSSKKEVKEVEKPVEKVKVEPTKKEVKKEEKAKVSSLIDFLY